MITRQALIAYLADYLACDKFQDYAPNGLQVQGKDSIKTLCTAVTASFDAIEKAVARGADALLVHHGYFWRGEDSCITGIKHQRIAALIKHDISLFAYHLPLDAHLSIGNNAGLGAMLPVKNIAQANVDKTPNILWYGELKQPMSGQAVQALLSQQLSREPQWVDGGKKEIKKIAWCTGGAPDYIMNAQALGVDAYISGEIAERTYYLAKELGVHYFAARHHATERSGVYNLGEHLAKEFSIKHYFIDSSNPV